MLTIENRWRRLVVWAAFPLMPSAFKEAILRGSDVLKKMFCLHLLVLRVNRGSNSTRWLCQGLVRSRGSSSSSTE